MLYYTIVCLYITVSSHWIKNVRMFLLKFIKVWIIQRQNWLIIKIYIHTVQVRKVLRTFTSVAKTFKVKHDSNKIMNS